jgi:hypothetical protein
MNLNIKNIIVIWADLGAGINFIKNSVLLNNNCHFPVLNNYDDRLSYLNNEIYPAELHLNKWLDNEYKLRTYSYEYGYDFTVDHYNGEDLENLLNDNCKEILKTQKVIFTVHEFNSVMSLRNRYNDIKIFFVRPKTDFGFCWQIRAYNEKKSIETMHNFTFKDNVEKQKEDFIATYGKDSYIIENLKNMMEIMKQRQNEWTVWAGENNILQIDLEDVIYNKISYIENIYKEMGIEIDINLHNKLYDLWMGLHWPIDQTNNWQYFNDELFKKIKIDLNCKN